MSFNVSYLEDVVHGEHFPPAGAASGQTGTEERGGDCVCHTPGVPFCQLGGGQPSIARREGGREERAGHREQELEPHEAASHHGQLSRLHHSPTHNKEDGGGGQRKRRRRGGRGRDTDRFNR